MGSGVLFVIGLVAVVLVGFWLNRDEVSEAEAGGHRGFVLPVTLAPVERGTLEPRVQLTGSVTSARHARLGFLLAGRINSLAVREGDVVTRGALLGELSDLDQQAQLARAQSARDMVQSELARDLAGTRAERLGSLEAELEARRADADIARRNVERNAELIGTEIISMSQYDTLVAVQAAADARVSVAEQELAEARAGTRPEDLDIRRADLALREAEVSIAQRELDKTSLKAPFDGHVVRRLAALGDMIGAGVPVFELVDLGRREIEIEIPSTRAGQLDDGARVVVTVDSMPGFRLETELDSLVVVADAESRNFRGIVRIGPDQDPEQVLKPGMFARLELSLRPLNERLLVPADALRQTPAGTLVVVARAGGERGPSGEPGLVAEWVPVRVLASEQGVAAIEVLGDEGEGLDVTDKVVLSGSDLAFPGATLMPRPAGEPQS